MPEKATTAKGFAGWLPAYAGLLMGVAFLALRFVWSDSLGSFADDSASYLLMAQCWSPYFPVSEVVAEACASESYPPLFPWVLALSGVSHDIALAHAAVVALLLGTGAALCLFAFSVFRSHGIACAVGALFFVAPVTWLNVLSILSENLYMLTVLAALYLYERNHAEEEQGVGLSLVLTLLLCGAVLTRTVGVSVVGAFLLTALFSRMRQRRLALYPALMAGLMALVWYGLHPPGGEVSYSADVRAALTGLVSGDRELWSQMGPQLENILASWFSSFLIYWFSETDGNYLVIALFGACTLLGTVLRAGANRPDGWYVLLYLGILAIWPYPGQIPRFLYALLPVLIAHGAFGIYAILRGASKAISPNWILVPLCLVLVTSALASSFIYFRAGHDIGFPDMDFSRNPEYYRKIDIEKAVDAGVLHASLFDDMDRLHRTVPEDSRIMWFTPAYLPLLADRRSVTLPSFEGRARFLQAVLDSGADYAFLSRFHPRRTQEAFNGLIWYRTFTEFARVIWTHPHPGKTETLSVLLKIDRSKIESLLQKPFR